MSPEMLELVARLDDELTTLQHQLDCVHGDALPANIKASLNELRQTLEKVELLLAEPDNAGDQYSS
jgi:hypothetical protein